MYAIIGALFSIAYTTAILFAGDKFKFSHEDRVTKLRNSSIVRKLYFTVKTFIQFTVAWLFIVLMAIDEWLDVKI